MSPKWERGEGSSPVPFKIQDDSQLTTQSPPNPSFFKTLINHEVTVELKNDIQIRGVLKSVDQYLNIKLDNIQVMEELKYPHLVCIVPKYITPPSSPPTLLLYLPPVSVPTLPGEVSRPT